MTQRARSERITARSEETKTTRGAGRASRDVLPARHRCELGTMSALQDAEHSTDTHGDDVYVVRHAAGDVVLRVLRDEDCASPLSPDAGDFLPRLAMIAGYDHHTDYAGTVDDVPYEMELDCPHCEGTGWVAYGHDQGEPDATPDEDGEVSCVPCVGTGQIEADGVDQYLRVTRDAGR